MTTNELSALIEHIRHQAGTWLGDEACENIERLVKHTQLLHERAERHDALLQQGYRFVKQIDLEELKQMIKSIDCLEKVKAE